MPFPMPVPVPFNLGMPMLGGPIPTAANGLFIPAPADHPPPPFHMYNRGKALTARCSACGSDTQMNNQG
ncbi:glucose dehydrogenase [Escherichia coli]|nr:glucose dehydrogenase [Escherichia coli]